MSTTKRIDGETPAGGTYAVLTFVDDELRAVDEKDATQVVVAEFDGDDHMIAETLGSKQ